MNKLRALCFVLTALLLGTLVTQARAYEAASIAPGVEGYNNQRELAARQHQQQTKERNRGYSEELYPEATAAGAPAQEEFSPMYRKNPVEDWQAADAVPTSVAAGRDIRGLAPEPKLNKKLTGVNVPPAAEPNTAKPTPKTHPRAELFQRFVDTNPQLREGIYKGVKEAASQADWAKDLQVVTTPYKDRKIKKPDEKSKGLDKLSDEDRQKILQESTAIKDALNAHPILKGYYVEVSDIGHVSSNGLARLKDFLSLSLQDKEKGPLSKQEITNAINLSQWDEFNKSRYNITDKKTKNGKTYKAMLIFFDDDKLGILIDPFHGRIAVYKYQGEAVCFDEKEMNRNGEVKKVKVLQKYYIK